MEKQFHPTSKYCYKTFVVLKEENKEETILPFVVFTLRNQRSSEGRSVHHFIGATAAGKSFRFGLERKAHTEYVAHGFP